MKFKVTDKQFEKLNKYLKAKNGQNIKPIKKRAGGDKHKTQAA